MSDPTLCFSYNCKSPPIPDVVKALQVRPVESQAASVETAPVPQIEDFTAKYRKQFFLQFFLCSYKSCNLCCKLSQKNVLI